MTNLENKLIRMLRSFYAFIEAEEDMECDRQEERTERAKTLEEVRLWLWEQFNDAIEGGIEGGSNG